MNRADRLTVLLACAALAVCSDSPEISLRDGLTDEQQALLIEKSIEQIETTANYATDDFERRQQAHLETMVEEMRQAALENLEKRAEKIAMLGMSQTIELDRESAQLETRVVDSNTALALFTATGKRTYRTENATKSSQTRFTLHWVVAVDGGELVYRHRGIRMLDTRD